MNNEKFAHEKANVDAAMAIVDQNDDTPSDTIDFNLQVNNNCFGNEIAIAWNNLHYEVVSRFWSKKQILRSLSGQCRVGTLNALMGPSGAGKTTLLRFLSGALRYELPSDSQILLRDGQASTSFFVEQHVQQTIVGELQVGHILEYAYHFKNGLLSKRDHMQRHIEYVLEQLLLPADIVHRVFSKCSGGEQKRVAIAQELMSRRPPDFLFIDEPTTGLDSASALEMVTCLRRLRTANPNIAVITSIHSPSDEIMRLLDFVYVLSRGGAAIYSGVPGDISKQLQEQINYSVPRDIPPIESLMKLACENVNTDKRLEKLEFKILETESKTIDQYYDINKSSTSDRGLSNPRKWFSFADLALELSRSARVTFVARIHTIVFYCLLFTSIFTFLVSLLGENSAKANGCVSIDLDAELAKNCTNHEKIHQNDRVKQYIFYIAMVNMLVGFMVMSNTALTYASNLNVFRSEHRNHWYGMSIFYWSSSIISFFEINIYLAFVAVASYFIGELHSADDYAINWTRFGFYYFYMFVTIIYLQAIGHLVGVIFFRNRLATLFACILIYSSISCFNGYFLQLERVGSELLNNICDLFGLIGLTRGLLWTIYGLDRCDSEREFSWVLIEYNIVPEQRWQYTWQIAINILVIRATMLAGLFFQCNDFFNFNIFNIMSDRMKNLKFETQDVDEIIIRSSNLAKKQVVRKARETKYGMSDEMDKNIGISTIPVKTEIAIISTETQISGIIIGWRNLTLYSHSSIIENIPESSFNRKSSRFTTFTSTTEFSHNSNKTISKKIILNDLNGQLRFGTLNALMGTSGAGKTSLLRVLNGRFKTRLDDSTRIYASTKQMIVTSFIEQEIDSHLISGLTAEQTLMYASWLKNGSSGSLDHREVAHQVLCQLQLDSIAHNRVERCSGGERKRLALGTEITNRTKAMPNLICIDEPTSGLDSNSSEIVIACLRDLAHQHGITIVASMHQPTVGILTRLLDHVYVLARSGVCIYSGVPSHIEAHLRSLPLIENEISAFPVETLVRHSCCDSRNPVVRALNYRTNQQYTGETSDEHIQLFEQTIILVDGVIPNRPRFSIHAAYVLVRRLANTFIANQWKIWLLYFLNFFVFGKSGSLIFDISFIHESGCLDPESDFNNTCTKSEQDLERDLKLIDNFIYVYYFIGAFLFLTLVCYSLDFTRNLANFAIEHHNGWYSTGTWYATNCTIETILSIPIIFAYLYQFDIYEPIRPIFWHMALMFVMAVVATQSTAHCVAILTKGNYVHLTVINVMLFITSMIFSNSYISLRRLHYVYRAASNVFVLRHMLEGILLLVFGFERCREREIQPLLYGRSLVDQDYGSILVRLALNMIVWRLVAIALLIRRSNEIEGQRRRAAKIEQYRRETLQLFP